MVDVPPLLAIRNLSIDFATRRGTIRAVDNLTFQVRKGETVGIVGESGSGKSVTSYGILRILDRSGLIASGEITFDGLDLVKLPERTMRALRGREISMIFQSPRTALNPIRRVGDQIADVLREHALAGTNDIRQKVIDLLDQVLIAHPEKRINSYPFELSGGMCQRVVIAMALACRPKLLIADEPTTGLDVTTQKAIMDLVMELTRARGMSTILITHDLGLAASYCDHVIVMEKGLAVESAASSKIFTAPDHAYTRRLMSATPRPGVSLRDLLPENAKLMADLKSPQVEKQPLLTVSGLVKDFPGRSDSLAPFLTQSPNRKSASFRAVDRISFEVKKGESVGLVGESGCGKSTTSMMIMRLIDPTDGTIVFDGEDIGCLPSRNFAKHPLRSRIQMVFQDPTESLNPRFTAERAIIDPLLRLGCEGNRSKLRMKCEELAVLVGLPLSLLERFPHQLSGGQKARVGIARAIAMDPALLILDEPTAALDVSVQAIVLNLLADLKQQLNMSYLFVSHDLNVVRLLCDRVIVMQAGRIVEEGSAEQVLEAPRHDYTRQLIAAIPMPPGTATDQRLVNSSATYN